MCVDMCIDMCAALLRDLSSLRFSSYLGFGFTLFLSLMIVKVRALLCSTVAVAVAVADAVLSQDTAWCAVLRHGTARHGMSTPHDTARRRATRCMHMHGPLAAC